MKTTDKMIPDFVKENPDAPATSGQTWALYCATKKDYRKNKLTRMQAFKLITEINEKNGYKSTIKVSGKFDTGEMIDLLMKDIDNFMKFFLKEIGIKSIVSDDPMAHQSGKKYMMLGCGCGTTVVTIKRRQKDTVEEIENKWQTAKNTFIHAFKKKIGYDTIRKLRECGNPIEAILAQNVNVGRWFGSHYESYLTSKGIEYRSQTFDD